MCLFHLSEVYRCLLVNAESPKLPRFPRVFSVMEEHVCNRSIIYIYTPPKRGCERSQTLRLTNRRHFITVCGRVGTMGGEGRWTELSAQDWLFSIRVVMIGVKGWTRRDVWRAPPSVKPRIWAMGWLFDTGGRTVIDRCEWAGGREETYGGRHTPCVKPRIGTMTKNYKERRRRRRRRRKEGRLI